MTEVALGQGFPRGLLLPSVHFYSTSAPYSFICYPGLLQGRLRTAKRERHWPDSKSTEIGYELSERTKFNTIFWSVSYEGPLHFSFMSSRLILSVFRYSSQYLTSKKASCHIGLMILETDCQVTYHEDEKLQDEEYESVMIYCWVPQMSWDTQLWKISVYIANRWGKIINRRPHAQSLYCRLKRRRRIILQGSTVQNWVWIHWLHKVMSKLRVWRVVIWRHVSHKYAEANWIHSS